MSPPPRGPLPTVDVIAEMPDGGIVLVRRKHPPPGWALPGGFVEAGESVAAAARRGAPGGDGARRRARRELFHVYANPARDPRGPTLSVVFIGRARGTPAGADDAAEARVFPLDALPAPLAFDHALILADYRRYRREGQRPPPDR